MNDRAPRVSSVAVPRDFALQLGFDDGTSREIDLRGELWGEMFEPLRDPEMFRKVAVDSDSGTVVWPNGADLDPDVLYGSEEPEKPTVT